VLVVLAKRSSLVLAVRGGVEGEADAVVVGATVVVGAAVVVVGGTVVVGAAEVVVVVVVAGEVVVVALEQPARTITTIKMDTRVRPIKDSFLGDRLPGVPVKNDIRYSFLIYSY
jgi:hypothetical protein